MKRLTTATLLALLAVPATAWAGAEGPGTPQATAANATFLANAPAPPAGGGVCVIDSGVDTDTDLGPALVSRVAQIGGVSGDPGDAGSVSDTGDALPKHGTYVAGVVASQPDGIGTSGIWPAAKIYSSRVFAGAATTTVNDYIRAMAWCSNQAGVKVINLSLSGLGATTIAQRDSLNDKITEVLGAPYFINVVAAAGNNGSATTVGYPASANGVFAVGATNSSGVIAPFSNRGAGLDISTLGVDVCITTSRGTRLASGDGTSYAAPLVSASLAALRSYDPALSPAHAEQLLLDGADIVNGFRVLNVANAFLADPAVAGMVAGAPHSGIDAQAASRCEAASAAPVGAGGSAATAAKHDAQPVSDPIEMQAPPVAAPIMDVPTVSAPVGASRLRRPTLRSLSMKNGVLTVRISGRQGGELAIYRIDRKTYIRATSVLQIRLASKRWRAVQVRLLRPGVGVSPSLTVRAEREF